MIRRTVVMLAVAAFATAALTGVAFANSKAKGNIEQKNGSCGTDQPGAPVLGTVLFKRVGNTVTLRIKFTKGEPNTHFKVVLYGPSCTILGTVVEMTTNAKGLGKAKGSIAVPEADKEFFADPYNGSYANDTPYVALP